jgi:GT2 family glycosyltransferase
VRFTPKVAILVLNYNGIKWLPRCLSSVAKTSYANYEVYLIDNASTDRSVEFVHRDFPSVRVIQNSRNLGFPEAYNMAIAQVDAEYVVMLNNDTEVLTPEWLDELVRVASADPKVAAVACKMVSMDDHTLLVSVGGMGIPYWRGPVDIGLGEYDVDQYPEGFEPFAFCGGAALVRKSIFTHLGFDGPMFLYFEDFDLSWRLRLLWWKIQYAPHAEVGHYLGGSTGGREVTPLRLYYCHRNLLRTIVRNSGSSLGWALRNYFLFSLLMIAGFAVYEPKKALAVLNAMFWNLRNLRTAYTSRQYIQNQRNVSESEILVKMYPNRPRAQPSEHATLRHVLNVLFEYGNRKVFQSSTEARPR